MDDQLPARYESFLRSVGVWQLEEAVPESLKARLPDEQTMQLLWHSGEFGTEFADDRGRRVTVIRYGRWNRAAGPDFLDALVEIDGERIKGDIELDACPQDWERHGHGASREFAHVVLHVACVPSSKVWFTRNVRHERVPLIVLPGDAVAPYCRGEQTALRTELLQASCRSVFAGMDREAVDGFLQSVAAYRLARKRRFWKRRCLAAGRDQVLYECLAETLGYTSNKMTMRHLARRVPLSEARDYPEPLLFGTAGFLVPVLKETCDAETRAYHKSLWDHWWKNREDYELSAQRAFPWKNGNVRPANHPQRRLAALALVIRQWDRFAGLCRLSSRKPLTEFLMSISHPYWSHHVTLPSARSDKVLALIGRDRALDFIINHVAAMDESEASWEEYLRLPGSTISSRVLGTARSLLGESGSVAELTKKAYQQQAFLQIHEDFCRCGCPENCPLPGQVPFRND